jgi:tripartite-type tricarboxylate transporter receptor subunit TctC
MENMTSRQAKSAWIQNQSWKTSRIQTRFRRWAVATAVAAALLALPVIGTVRVVAAEDFYKGKTIYVVAGYGVGGGYDTYARILANHLGNHIPGNPTVVPQNMPGAGGLKAALYLYSVAPKDGTVIGTFGRNIALMPLLNANSPTAFDGTKFDWLGSVTSEVSLCLARKTSAIKRFDDMLTTQYVVGGNQSGSDADVLALALRDVFAAKIKLVAGYPGTSEIALAMERGEIDGLCGMSYGTLKSTHRAWLTDGSVNLLVQMSLTKDPELPNVPLITDFVKSPEQLQILKLLVATQAMARPFTAPPGLPADRKAILEKAFADTMADPDFRAEMAQRGLDVEPIPPAAIEALLQDLYATPKPVLEQASSTIGHSVR